MNILAVDPGSRVTALASLSRKSLSVQVLRAKGEVGMICQVVDEMRYLCEGWIPYDHVVVEGQEYRHARGSNPNQLMPLAHVAGAVAGAALRSNRDMALTFARPTEWKGTVPKLPHNMRTAKKLGWKFHASETKAPYVVVDDCGDTDIVGEVRPREWSDVLDAVGLALWMKGQKR